MPETRVPMTLRDHFLQDPFFSSAWSDVEKFRENFFQDSQSISRRFEDNWNKSESSESRKIQTDGSTNGNSSLVPSRSWMLPRQWMMPKGFDDNLNSLLDMKDSNLISLKNDDTKMEISLNTAGYKPSELKVNVADGEVTIEGKHEEKSEEGHTMVLRQFSRKYALPSGAKLTEVVSNLSQDGVMVITVPKEKKIEEVTGSQKMKVENKSANENKEYTKSQKQEVTATNEDLKMNVERKTSAENRNKIMSSLVPITSRDSFFDDPFFKDTWLDIETSQKNFFETSRKFFEESLKSMETNMKSLKHFDTMDRTMPKILGEDSNDIFNPKDSNLIRMVNDDSKMEISLDTTGYKADELKVSAGQGMICVEGKHEEKSEAGQVMVSRQFSRKYSLPAGAKAEDVVSNLSQDGVLVISVPKGKAIQNENRSVPIAIK